MIMNEIFRAGIHISSDGSEISISEIDLLNTASAYNASLHEAPFVIGHPADNAPAYGWVENLFVKNGSLFASAKDVNDEFAQIVNDGYYKKISASFYMPSSAVNPVPGTWYLRHVGLLGAQPPAVKGMKNAQFEEASDYILFKDVNTMADNEVVQEQLPELVQTDDPAPVELEEIVAETLAIEETVVETVEPSVDLSEIEAMRVALVEQQHKLNDDRKALMRDKYAHQISFRVQSGNISKDAGDLALNFLETLSANTADFGESTTADLLFKLLDTIAPTPAKPNISVSLGEVSAPTAKAARTPSQMAEELRKIAETRNIPLHVAAHYLGE